MYVTDLDFADNITLLSGTMANAQSILAAVEENVGCCRSVRMHEAMQNMH